MRKLRYALGLIAAVVVPAQSAAADMNATINSHMSQLSWMVGTYSCVSKTNYSNGKSRTDKVTVTISPTKNGWMATTVAGQPGVGYWGYDPKKNKYVSIGVGGPGDYGAGYFHITGDSTIVFDMPDVMDNDVMTANDYSSISRTSNGYGGKDAGPSDRYPGLRYTDTYTCVRQ
jgi:hypothetical protein